MLNFIKRTVPVAIVFVLSGYILNFIIAATSCSCSALDVYLGEGFFEIISSFIVGTVMLFVGIGVYFFMRKRVKHRLRFKYLYWSLLPLLILSGPIYDKINNWKYRRMELSICQKSNSDGSMNAKSTGLDLREYDYFKKHMKVFVPELPGSAKNIDISFYGDDFLGDFSLNISFTCAIQEKIIKGQNWGIESVDESHATQRAFYSSHVQ